MNALTSQLKDAFLQRKLPFFNLLFFNLLHSGLRCQGVLQTKFKHKLLNEFWLLQTQAKDKLSINGRISLVMMIILQYVFYILQPNCNIFVNLKPEMYRKVRVGIIK